MRLVGILAVFAVLLALSCSASAGLDVNSYNYEPLPATPGKSFDLWVHVKNSEYRVAENAVLELDASYPFSVGDQNAIVRLGTMDPYQISIVKFKVSVDPTANDGSYSIGARVGRGGVIDKVVQLEIKVSTKKPVVDLVQSSLLRASPGEEVQTQLKLRNIGTSLATDIMVKVEEDRTVTSTGIVVEREIVPLGATATYVPSLGPGEETTVNLLLSVNSEAELKNYTVPLKINYYDVDRNMLSTTAYLGVKVTAQPDIDAVINEISNEPYPGGTSEFRFDIFNVGVATAKYVVVELSSDVAEISEPKQFIGTLEADSFDSFKANLKFRQDAAMGPHNVELRVTFKDQDNKSQTLVKGLQFTLVALPTEAAVAYTAIFEIIFIITLLAVAAWYLLKRRGIDIFAVLGKGAPKGR